MKKEKQQKKQIEKQTSKTIGIIGSRSRDSIIDYIKVRAVFRKHYRKGDIICSGLCPEGGDWFAFFLSEYFKIKSLWFPADWDTYGRSAGFIRNTDIAKSSNVLIACVSKLRTGGTEDTIKKFIKFHGKNNLIIVR